MKRYVAGCLACVSLVFVPAAAASSASTPRPPRAHEAAILTDVAGAFAGKLATGGATYLVGKLQGGALGGTGVTIGNFLSDAGLGDPNAAVLTTIKEEFKVVNERLVGLQQEVGVLGTKLDQLGATVSNGNYAILVALANKLRSAVLTGDRKLREIANAPTSERRTLAKEFVDFYKRELQDKELEFENYLTGGGVPGAEGIIKVSSRKARSAAQPFFTHTMSQFPRQVVADYTMVQAVWLQERVNVMHFEHIGIPRIEAAIKETTDAIGREYREVPSALVFPNTVVDTRTNLLWSWRIDPSGCKTRADEIDAIYNRADQLNAELTNNRRLTTAEKERIREEIRALIPQRQDAYRAYNQCLYDHGADAAEGVWDLAKDPATTEPTNGSPPGTGAWKRPTADQLRALDAGASGSVPNWLAQRGGFPSKITGEVWTSSESGSSATTYNQSTGAVNNRPKTEKHWSLVQGADYQAARGDYWVQ